jgi:hypothetical protein
MIGRLIGGLFKLACLVGVVWFVWAVYNEYFAKPDYEGVIAAVNELDDQKTQATGSDAKKAVKAVENFRVNVSKSLELPEVPFIQALMPYVAKSETQEGRYAPALNDAKRDADSGSDADEFSIKSVLKGENDDYYVEAEQLNLVGDDSVGWKYGYWFRVVEQGGKWLVYDREELWNQPVE